MMGRKRALWMVVGFMMLLGGGLAASPFVLSLLPRHSADRALAHIDVSSMKPGDFQVFFMADEPSPFRGVHPKYFVLRDYQGAFRVYRLYANDDGTWAMPDIHWWRPFYACKDFGPDAVQGRLKPGGAIRCRDVDGPAVERFTWGYDGRHIPSQEGDYADDLDVPLYSVERGQIILGKG